MKKEIFKSYNPRRNKNILINMANPELIQWIKEVEQKGFSREQIMQQLVNNGWKPEEINEALNNKSQPKSSKIKWEIIIPIGASLIFIIALMISLIYVKMPTCGNGIVEQGETSEKCCKDAGCSGQSTCENNKCVEPKCNSCQYLENDECKNFACCSDTECNDNLPNSTDNCFNPKTLKAECIHVHKISLSTLPLLLNLDDKNSANFDFDGKNYEFFAQNIQNSAAEIKFTQDKIISLKINQSSDIDLQLDGKEDVSVKLLSVENSKARISLKKVTYACFKDSDCDDKNTLTVDKCMNAGMKDSICLNDRTSCGKCEYLDDGKCIPYKCCGNKDCEDGKTDTLDICLNPKTKEALCKNDKFTCGGCQYNDNGVCKKYVCCADSECADSNSSSLDKCVNPKNLQAVCTHT